MSHVWWLLYPGVLDFFSSSSPRTCDRKSKKWEEGATTGAYVEEARLYTVKLSRAEIREEELA